MKISGFNRISGFLLLLLFINSACSHKSQPQTIMVPVNKDIPHYNDSHIIINRKTTYSKFPGKSDVLNTLNQYLQNPQKFSLRKLQITADVGNVISLNKDNVLLLDTRNNRLIEYNISNDKSMDVAKNGRGPGELLFSKDMVKRGDRIYLANQMQVSRFNCNNQPCAYAGETKLGFIPSSLTISGDSLAILGSFSMRGINKKQLKNKLEHLKAVHVVKLSGKSVTSFGQPYAIHNQWMLIRPFVSDGLVRYLPNRKQYIVAYKRLPLIYVYNQQFKLQQTYKIADFFTGKQKYIRKKLELFIVNGNFSRIQHIVPVNDNNALIIIRTLTKLSNNKNPRKYKLQYDFYDVDFKGEQSYYLGSINPEKPRSLQNIFVTGSDIFIYKNATLFRVVTKK